MRLEGEIARSISRYRVIDLSSVGITKQDDAILPYLSRYHASCFDKSHRIMAISQRDFATSHRNLVQSHLVFAIVILSAIVRIHDARLRDYELTS